MQAGLGFRRTALGVEIRERLGNGLSALLPNAHDSERPVFLLETIEIGVEFERKSGIAGIAWLFAPLVIIGSQHLSEMLLHRVGEGWRVLPR